MGKRLHNLSHIKHAETKIFESKSDFELRKTFYNFYPRVYNFVSVFVSESTMAEKITQNVMHELWLNKDSFLIKGNVEYYLASKVLDCVKKKIGFPSEIKI